MVGLEMGEQTRCVKQMLGLAIAISLVGGSSYVQAASVDNVTPTDSNRPTAGSLLSDQQQKQEAGVKVPGAATIEVQEEERPSLNLPNELKVQVNGYKITGQTIYPEEKLKALLAERTGKVVSFGDLQKNADILTKYFKDQGYLAARVIIPVQKITNGIVEYSVSVGRFDTIKIENNTNIHDTVLQQEIQFLKKGDYIQKREIERAVWLLSDLAGADAKLTISPGSVSGTSNMLIVLNPFKGKNGLIYTDNYGNRSTGYNEVGITYDFLNPFHEGDHFAIDVVTTGKKLTNGSMNYTIPIWWDGLTVNAGVSRLSYKLGDIYEDLDAVGTATVYHLGFNYAIQRSRRHNLYVGLRGEHSVLMDEYRNLSDYGMYNDKQSNAAILALYGDEQDAKGYTGWRTEYKYGTLSFGSAATHYHFDSANTEGNYSKFNANILRRQSVNNRLYILFSARGQYASRNLDSSERMSLGGASGVRAYPQGEASGDIGYLTRIESRWLLPLKKQDQSLQFATYLDHGAVRINKSGGNANYRKLQGVGIGLVWSRKDDWFLRADYAWRLGAEQPKSDTSHANGHFWIQGGVYF